MKNFKIKAPTRKELAELVLEIGGETALFSILREFYERMSHDLMIGFFFAKLDLDHISRMQGKFFLLASGLTKAYEGKGPSTAHSSLPPIQAGHFNRRIILLRETLNSRGLSEKQIELWVSFEESFRAIVVSD